MVNDREAGRFSTIIFGGKHRLGLPPVAIVPGGHGPEKGPNSGHHIWAPCFHSERWCKITPYVVPYRLFFSHG